MDISEQLSSALKSFDYSLSSSSEYLRDPWLATSALQKAIRRGDLTTALQAATFLAAVRPDKLWRRLVVIALEDIGIADLDLVRMVLWVSGKRAWRRANRGEEKVASYVVSQLCRATKCRDACDVLVIADHHPSLKQQREEFADLPANDLSDIVANSVVLLPERVLAAWYLAGTGHFPSALLKQRSGSFRMASEVYEQIGVPPHVLEVAQWGATRTQEAHPVSLPLIWLEASRTQEQMIPDEAPVSLGPIQGWPSEAWDMHCRPGQRATTLFIRELDRGLDPIRKHVKPGLMPELVGTAIFRVEGALVDRRLVYPGSEAVLAGAEIAHCCYGGLPQEQVGLLLQIVKEHLPQLHHCRVTVAGVSQ